jgi:hypothetical protein
MNLKHSLSIPRQTDLGGAGVQRVKTKQQLKDLVDCSSRAEFTCLNAVRGNGRKANQAAICNGSARSIRSLFVGPARFEGTAGAAPRRPMSGPPQRDGPPGPGLRHLALAPLPAPLLDGRARGEALAREPMSTSCRAVEPEL